jgi:hypothetical protein
LRSFHIVFHSGCRQQTEWGKIFESYTSDKRLTTKIYRELKKLNFPKISGPMKK